MKTFGNALASLVLVATPCAAFAQSSVTLYGLLDEGVGFVKTAAGNQYAALSGNINGDRWGLKGREDLGSGLAAVFQLENGFNINTGMFKQGGREFGRQSYVGLASQRWGTVTLGRQYDPVVDAVQPITADVIFGTAFATPGDVDNYDNSLRTSNAIKYVSPAYHGLKLDLLYAFSGISGSPGQGQTWGAAASYGAGPWSVAAGYLFASNPGGTSDRSGWNSPTSDSLFFSPINDGYQTAHALGIARVAAQYQKDSVTAGLSYSNVQIRPDAASAFERNEHFNAASAFGAYKPQPNLTLALGYTFVSAGGDTSATYHQVNLGADYRFSVRTGLYLLAAYEHASGMQRVASGGTRTAQASIGAYGYAGTASQELLIVGVRHRF
jgi:predicted porin